MKVKKGRTMMRSGGAAAGLALLSACMSAPAGPPPAVHLAAPMAARSAGCEQMDPAQDARAAAFMNAIRAEAGLPAVAPHPVLNVAAGDQACRMAGQRRLTHRDPSGGISARLRTRGYAPRVAAENVAGGAGSLDAAMAMWAASAGHRANIMNPRVRHVGIGQAGSYWSLILATR